MSENSSLQIATLDQLFGKKTRTETIPIEIEDENGPIKLGIKIQALPSEEYDDLITQHPPKEKDKREGAQWNPDTFAPALMQRCLVEPALDLDAARRLWKAETWSSGELIDLFQSVVRINLKGLNVPKSDSA